MYIYIITYTSLSLSLCIYIHVLFSLQDNNISIKYVARSGAGHGPSGARARLLVLSTGGNHLSTTNRLAHAFFKSGERCSKLYCLSIDTAKHT